MPRTLIVPLVGMRSVASIFIVVVLPAPFGPSRPKISPRSTRRSMPSTAWKRSRRSGSPRSRCQKVRRPRSKTFRRPRASTAGPAAVAVIRPARSFDEDLHPIVVVGDVDDLAREVHGPEQLVEVNAELAEMAAHERARRELHLADPRDRERDRDVDLLLAVLGHADAEDPAAGPGGFAPRGPPHRPGAGGPARGFSGGSAHRTDVPERAEEPVGLVDVDLALRKEREDLLPLFARHGYRPRAASSSAAASSTESSPRASR